MQNARKAKIIVILGPTSSGKSDVAIRLAKKFNGEIISADSRQVYRGLDIGTGKTTIKEQKGIKHYLIDVVSPRTNYNAARFKKEADKIIENILKRGKLPIICGGTGFWIKSIVDNVSYPEIRPDWKLRNKLRNYPADKLFIMLKKLDPERAKNIDVKNKIRLIRAIEICKTLGKVPLVGTGPANSAGKRDLSAYDFLQIGISLPKEKLRKNIEKRLRKRFGQGMIEEVKNLHEKYNLSWKKIESFGLGYFWIPKFSKGEISAQGPLRQVEDEASGSASGGKTENELFQKVFQAEKDYAKRQMTWFRKDKRIIWSTNYKKIEKITNTFIKK